MRTQAIPLAEYRRQVHRSQLPAVGMAFLLVVSLNAVTAAPLLRGDYAWPLGPWSPPTATQAVAPIERPALSAAPVVVPPPMPDPSAPASAIAEPPIAGGMASLGTIGWAGMTNIQLAVDFLDGTVIQ